MEISDEGASLLPILGALSIIVTPRRQRQLISEDSGANTLWCPLHCGEQVTTHPRSGTERNFHRDCLKPMVFSSVSSFCPCTVNNGKLRSLPWLRIPGALQSLWGHPKAYSDALWLVESPLLCWYSRFTCHLWLSSPGMNTEALSILNYVNLTYAGGVVVVRFLTGKLRKQIGVGGGDVGGEV